ncbi:MAG: DUF1016 N-terminal domain-containing protein [Mycobacteriales bacterium]
MTLTAGYPQLLDELKRAVRTARLRAHQAANTELIGLYWRLGSAVAGRQQEQGWGGKVIDRLAADLRGLSRSNLFYMRQFAPTWSHTASSNSLLDDCPGVTSPCYWTSSTTRPIACRVRPSRVATRRGCERPLARGTGRMVVHRIPAPSDRRVSGCFGGRIADRRRDHIPLPPRRRKVQAAG